MFKVYKIINILLMGNCHRGFIFQAFLLYFCYLLVYGLLSFYLRLLFTLFFSKRFFSSLSLLLSIMLSTRCHRKLWKGDLKLSSGIDVWKLSRIYDITNKERMYVWRNPDLVRRISVLCVGQTGVLPVWWRSHIWRWHTGTPGIRRVGVSDIYK